MLLAFVLAAALLVTYRLCCPQFSSPWYEAFFSCNWPQLLVLGAANFFTEVVFGLGGTGGGNRDLDDSLKDGLARLCTPFNCCLTILRPTAAATRLPLEVSLLRPRGGGGGGGVSFLYGTGMSLEVEAETTLTNLLLRSSEFSSRINGSFLADAVLRNFLTAPPLRTLSRAVWLRLAFILGDRRFFWKKGDGFLYKIGFFQAQKILILNIS